jgi:hypothetical protein
MPAKALRNEAKRGCALCNDKQDISVDARENLFYFHI